MHKYFTVYASDNRAVLRALAGLYVLSPPRAKDKTLEVNMTDKNEKILYRVKGSRLLFIVKNVWRTLWYAIGVLLCVGLGTLAVGGITGIIFNNGKMNSTIVEIGILLIPILIALRILHIVLLRKNQFYTITGEGVVSEGGVLTRFSHTLKFDEIQSVSCTQTLVQQILGCGNIVISSAAAFRAGMVLNDVDHVREIYQAINRIR